jgi:hypothetical protein
VSERAEITSSSYATHGTAFARDCYPVAPMKKERLALLLPALAAFLLFLPMLGGGFLYDDHELLTRNPRIGDPGLLLESFQKPFWEVISPLRTAAGFYRPLGAWLLA